MMQMRADNMRMRPHDGSIRLRAYGFAALATLTAVLLVHAYATDRSPLAWWVLLAGAAVCAVHFYRRSRK